MSESLKKKKGIRFQGPFPFFKNKMEHLRVKCSLLFLIFLVTFKLARTKITQLPESYVTSDKHNVRLI